MLGTHGAWRRVVPAAVVGVVAGCGVGVSQLPSAPPSVAATPTPSAASAASEDLERLRALGYLDYSEEAPSMPGGGVVSLDRERVQPGYTLVVYAGACACDLITITGEVVRSWSDQPCRRWEQARLLGDGSLLVVAAEVDQDEPVNQQMEGRSLLKLGWDGSVLWRRRLNVHHDVQVLPDGRLLTLLMERRLIPGIDPSVEVWDDLVALLNADGEVLETLSVYDALAAASFPFTVVGRGERGGERWVDLLHCNAIDWIGPTSLAGRHAVYEPDNVLVTSRHQDAILVVNWATRRLVWQWGRGELSGPHAASWQDDGRILVFDNGLARRWSRVIEVDPVTAAIVRSYTTPDKRQFFSRVMGACQRLANGNVLIANSAGGQGLELTAGGQPVWTFLGTRSTASGRRVKISRLHRIPAALVDGIAARHP